MPHESHWLQATLVYLVAAIAVVPLARKFGLGTIIGYLAAGMLIGPFGLRLVRDPDAIMNIAEFGVVLMMFLIGLELEPPRLWSMRRAIFGWGSVQLLGCALALGLVAQAGGVPWPLPLVAGLGLALSSTAVSLQVMQERNLMSTSGGQAAFAILLFQDVAAIPILALIPLLAPRVQAAGNHWGEALRALAVVAGIILAGRLLLRHALRWIARSGSPEIFTAAALALVVALASLMHAVDLSMALGAFLGGVLLAESEYRRELETDLEPFKGLLLGLFFMAVGMSIDFHVIAAHALLVAGLLAGFLAIKALVLLMLARRADVPAPERPVFTLLLAQGGEFAFVVFQQASDLHVIDDAQTSVLIGTVALSMLVTPLLLVALDRRERRRAARVGPVTSPHALSEPQSAPVIIAGFGRYGQIVGRMLNANGIAPTVLDHDAEQVEALRGFGFRVHYGDATRLDLLRTAGAATAKVLVVAIDDVDQSLKLVDLAREHFPHLVLVARARNVRHWFALRDRGVTLIERETLDASLMSARGVLEQLGWHPAHAREQAMRFRRHSIAQLEQLWPHHRDEKTLVSMSRQGRRQLEELFAQERAERAARPERWSDDPPAPRDD
ncbi:glutathione-regulated potassium-efflux system protein KefC [Sphaerotilus uruguayifluvii]|uniref:Glutathione-regulated potassium-efflux system ancillary protein KefC n=1 Tax=Sphaerotilus uruguayifluvii TaxID=2735897 RepID=A0ABX2FWM9_9BURK|nr:glutathione-regulated potassium-efflux system protein KefC [Leptothrix sp. C29]NRT54423.1 glutathione-regulated potassium-efflux system ancillary protein KefC [Leptothrix sp. C29]